VALGTAQVRSRLKLTVSVSACTSLGQGVAVGVEKRGACYCLWWRQSHTRVLYVPKLYPSSRLLLRHRKLGFPLNPEAVGLAQVAA
jgi:hypothetical protein